MLLNLYIQKLSHSNVKLLYPVYHIYMVVLGIEIWPILLNECSNAIFSFDVLNTPIFCCLQQIAIKINRNPLEYIIKLPLHNEVKYFANCKGSFLQLGLVDVILSIA